MPQLRFADVIGHEEIVSRFQSALKEDKIVHAYILAGVKGSGKKLIADIFATALQCTGEKGDACLECTSCKKAANQNHPDIIRLEHEKPNTITVDEIREQVIAQAVLKPYESKRKVFIIPDAEKMTPQAQNALLKTIEEPPAYAVFILLATQAEALLPTVVSRCVVMEMKPLRDEVIRDFLIREHHLPKYEAEVAAAFAQGNIGRAQEVALEGAFSDISERVVQLLRRIRVSSMSELLEFMQEAVAEKHNINDYLEILTLWFRDVLMYKATREIDRMVFKKEIRDIKQQAERSSYEGLEQILQDLERASLRLRSNVSVELTLELLLLSIRENLNG
ncbi:MAG: DNA polymerase III subunit delta' [Lachnospiraceae bacterium]|nr:DNA polymerase III subunit delta' [Candidatus Equihabitans merdae]